MDGGVRAIEHLRGITAELGMAGVGPQVSLNLFEDFDQDGRCAPRDRQVKARSRLLAGLARWAGALRELRQTDDSGAGGPGAESADGSPRPTLHQPSRTADAEDAVRQLIERLQNGLDRGDADHYDSMLADDVLWGSPYGQVLSGYDQLNTAHRSRMTAPPSAGSRYELVQALGAAPDVVVAHVRRQSLPADDLPADDKAPGGFSEMAMYVLVRRGGHWWLAGGQNTPIRDKP